jgi:hypothetical protein
MAFYKFGKTMSTTISLCGVIISGKNWPGRIKFTENRVCRIL